ncbi:uncharacterized protein LOC143548930 [Bidens hawaiensis]|uniref:uncharacterized protein LOC143548930 n=1 Tax=Bidens hawaiensis TaxID=980011 RepID=UPI00404A564C
MNTTNTTTLKLKISKLFHSSFNSCRTKHTSDDVSGHPFFFPENHHHHRQLIDLFSPKPQHPLSSFSRRSKPIFFPRQKISGEDFPAAGKSIKPNSGKKKKTHHRKPIKIQDFASVTDNYYYDCCSSDEDDEIDDEATLFSSKSFSSDSSKSKNRARRRKLKSSGAGAGGGGSSGGGGGAGGGGGCKGLKATDVISINGIGKLVKESVAVVKKSTDPYGDFRVSMLEMIVERQIVGAQDLEDLLKCFLTLNSEEHHAVICEVFTEIWETLFYDW